MKIANDVIDDKLIAAEEIIVSVLYDAGSR